MRIAATLLSPFLLAACGGGSTTTTATTPATAPATVIVDPAALYCQGTGGTIIQRTVGGRRADLCRLPGGRTVSAADWLNSHNDL